MIVTLLAAMTMTQPLSAEIVLADWGLERADQIAWVETGTLKYREKTVLLVYDVRGDVPTAPKRAHRRHAPTLANGVFVIDAFAGGNINALGGYTGTFAKAPSTGLMEIVRPQGEDRAALSFRFDRKDRGFCGFWVHLFDFKAAERIFLDVTKAGYLTFEIRGDAGGEPVWLQAADRVWESKGDSLAIGDVAGYLPSRRIETDWQRANIPLRTLPKRLDPRDLAALIFRIPKAAKGRVYVRNLALTTEPDTPLPRVRRDPPKPRPLEVAMWVWETPKIAASPAEITRLVTFSKRWGITVVYLQLPKGGPKVAVPILRALHDAGIKVDALDGDPRYALREHHDKVLSMIGDVTAHNRASPPRDRFDGIRYDNEPYLLRGFMGGRKERVLRQYLELVRKASVKARGAGLPFGVDIPFWFDATNRFGEPAAELDGRPMSELVLDAVDNIAIMDYRTVAYGPDGTLAHGAGELAYALRVGKPVLIGLETVFLPDERIQAFRKGGPHAARIHIRDLGGGKARVVFYTGAANPLPGDTVLTRSYVADAPGSKLTFFDLPKAAFDRVVRHTTRELLPIPSFGGFAIHSYESYAPFRDK